MGILFGATGWAGWLGWQWRRTRTIGDDIKALKAQLPKPAAGETEAAPAAPAALTQQISALEKVRVRVGVGTEAVCRTNCAGWPSACQPAAHRKCSSDNFPCAALMCAVYIIIPPNQQQERKELVAGGYRDKHFWWGSVLLGGGVLIGVEGAFNTWFRTGKLFPGPHLFAGAGIVVLWALAAALVPQMQKGNEGARNAHIALNALNLALFAWQVRGVGWLVGLNGLAERLGCWGSGRGDARVYSLLNDCVMC